jgi:predicted aspartyl protease
MTTNGQPQMGRFKVEIEVANNEDLVAVRLGNLAPAKVRRKTIQGVVDSGASRLVLPQSLVKELGLPIKKSKARVRYADSRKGLRPEADRVRILLMGRDSNFTAVVEPKRETALIGAIVLDELDFLVDCKNLCLVPRDPRHIVSEIE